MSQIDWVLYDQWNTALDERLFTRDQQGLPVYVDCDLELLSACAADLGLTGDGLQLLVDAVRPTLGVEEGPALAQHDQRFKRWRRLITRSTPTARRASAEDVPPPPVLALLAVLVIAAGQMGADADMAANAYYPRLNALLGLDDRQGQRLRSRFPATEQYWAGLNNYLAHYEGEFGLPTAYALGHRYVGIPQSQALIRATDRNRLTTFFGTFGLAPGSEMVAADLERLLDAWISVTPTPVSSNLSRLWKSGKARERVSGVVAIELAAWDGRFRDAEGEGSTRGDLALTALVRQQFGRKAVELSFAARFPTLTASTVLEVASAEGSPAIGVVPAAGGRVRPVPGTRLDPNSLVGSQMELRDLDGDQVVTRRPRRLVPLRRDELLGVLSEIDRVQLADDTVLLVRDEGALPEKVLAVLETYGHYGTVYSSEPTGEQTSLAGMPTGWLLIDDVQLYAIPQDIRSLDLQALVPISTAQLNLSGGLKMPGRVRKWSSLHPPEVRAVVGDAEKISVTLTDLGEERTELERWSVNGSAIAIPLEGLELENGDYELELSVNGEPISVTTLRLRSGAAPDLVSWEQSPRLNYDLHASALAVVSADEQAAEGSPLLVDGPNALGEAARQLAPVHCVEGINWSKTSSSAPQQLQTVVLGKADPTTCLMTGKHRIELPIFHGGKSKGVIEGVCGTCGIRKVYPARPKWKSPQGPTPTAQMLMPDPPDRSVATIGWDACLDALIHVGGGSLGALERVATQREGSSLFTDSFLRTLEGLGHIDVRRDEALQPVEWEANPAYLAETPSKGFALMGVWSTQSRHALGKALHASGGTLECEGDPEVISTWFARGTDSMTLTALVEDAGIEAYVLPDSVDRMLAALPPLSAVEAALPEVAIPTYNKAAIFNLRDAAWRVTPGVGAPGAYRLEQSFRTRTIWVDDAGALSRLGRVGSVQLVKHLAARAAGQPLVGWLPGTETLVVPLGADLPGLYGRAAMLCSGRPPQASRAARALGYPGVPRRVADALTTLLVS